MYTHYITSKAIVGNAISGAINNNKKTKTNVNATRKHTPKHLEWTFTVCVVSPTTTIIILHDNYLQYARRTAHANRLYNIYDDRLVWGGRTIKYNPQTVFISMFFFFIIYFFLLSSFGFLQIVFKTHRNIR